jgi:hypothetical protein
VFGSFASVLLLFLKNQSLFEKAVFEKSKQEVERWNNPDLLRRRADVEKVDRTSSERDYGIPTKDFIVLVLYHSSK